MFRGVMHLCGVATRLPRARQRTLDGRDNFAARHGTPAIRHAASRGAGYGNGAALKIMALVQSTGFAFFMPAVRKAKVELRGFNSPAQSRQREAVCWAPCGHA